LQKYYRKLKNAEKRRPCVMTAEELQEDVLQALKDIKNGRVTSHEQLLKEIRTW
jgi:O6-methylguanine-DNA--protein-cysteine methyltransferase